MQFRAWMIIAALLLSGCGTTPTPARLRSNETLRQACGLAGLNQADADAVVEALLGGLDEARRQGYGHTDLLAAMTRQCSDEAGNDADEAALCTACFTALIDQIYGE